MFPNWSTLPCNVLGVLATNGHPHVAVVCRAWKNGVTIRDVILGVIHQLGPREVATRIAKAGDVRAWTELVDVVSIQVASEMYVMTHNSAQYELSSIVRSKRTLPECVIADVDTVSDMSMEIAVLRSNIDMLNQGFQQGKSTNFAFLYACARNDMPIIEMLLSRGAWNLVDAFVATPHEPVQEYLCDIDPTILVDSRIRSSLLSLVRLGNFRCASRVLSCIDAWKDANNVYRIVYQTMMHPDCPAQHMFLGTLLKKLEADCEVAEYVLRLSAATGNLAACHIALDAGACRLDDAVSVCDMHSLVLRLLLERGANASIAFERACACNGASHACAYILRQHDIDVDWHRCLQRAFRSKDSSIVSMVLNANTFDLDADKCLECVHPVTDAASIESLTCHFDSDEFSATAVARACFRVSTRTARCLLKRLEKSATEIAVTFVHLDDASHMYKMFDMDADVDTVWRETVCLGRECSSNFIVDLCRATRRWCDRLDAKVSRDLLHFVRCTKVVALDRDVIVQLEMQLCALV